MTAYYNEMDPYAAAWLRNLISAGLIAPGEVDERSIVDVRADDLVGFSQCHFFAGIGGWSRALRLAGWGDDRPVWTGSCPCQPFSAAGKQQGVDDARHLWPVWFDLIRKRRPSTVFGEQVAAAVGHSWLDAVQGDMEGEGYAVGAAVLGAHSVGAPHIRQRLWFVADAERSGSECGGATTGREARSGTGAAGGNGSGGMGDPGGAGSQVCEREAVLGEGRRHEGGATEQPGGSLGGVADAGIERRQQVPGSALGDEEADGRTGRHGCGSHSDNVPASDGEDHRPGPLHGFWRDADWLFCRDGKWRPVRPGTFPLAARIPNRVGRLRAYGNAIVPQVAAEFIGAYLDAGAEDVYGVQLSTGGDDQ